MIRIDRRLCLACLLICVLGFVASFFTNWPAWGIFLAACTNAAGAVTWTWHAINNPTE